MGRKKIAVALSGGVDSALTASLLKEKGYQLIGFYFHLYDKKGSVFQARQTAEHLGIPLEEIDLRQEFKQKIIKEVLRRYKRGLVPNPCILCNKLVRFKKGLELVQKHDCQALATGHYARISPLEFLNPRVGLKIATKVANPFLLQARDKKKDQSYFLYFLRSDQLKKLIFPLGNWLKKDVWREAKKRDLPALKSRESFDLCFTCNLQQFLKNNLKDLIQPGPVVNLQGEALGKHHGLAFYTTGYRGGWDWSPQAQKKYSRQGKLPKLYVVRKNLKENQLVVGSRPEASRDSFKLKIGHWQRAGQGEIRVKIRSMGELLEIKNINIPYGETNFASPKVNLKFPQLGITSGQAAVFYQQTGQGWAVIGGGEIRAC